MKFTKLLGGLAFGVLPFGALPALAQDYPAKPVELVCSTSAGSTAAQWCQLVSTVLQQKDVMNIPVNVSYRGAGSGNEAGVYVHRRPADGYTLLHANASWSGYMNLPTFEPPVDDFEFLVRVEKFIYALGTNSQSDIKTFADAVTKAKAEPGTLSVAGNKIGSIHHKHILNAFTAADAEVIHIPYEGSGDAIRDVLGGHLPLGLGTIGQLQSHVQAGNIRPIVVLNEERVPAMPDVPSIKELGYDYPISHQWQGIFVRKDTPEPVKQALREAFAKLVESEGYKDYLSKSPHVVPAFEADPAKLQDALKSELDDYKAFMSLHDIL